MLKVVRLVTNGNSTQVTIPKPLLFHLGWRAGDHVVLTLREDRTLSLERGQVTTATRGVVEETQPANQLALVP